MLVALSKSRFWLGREYGGAARARLEKKTTMLEYSPRKEPGPKERPETAADACKERVRSCTTEYKESL